MAESIKCPLCDWHLDAEAPNVHPGMLAEVFGVGVMAAVAQQRHLEQVERQLRGHLETHSLVEWVTKVRELQAERDAAKIEAVLNSMDAQRWREAGRG